MSGKLVFGVGTNDADYSISKLIGGKRVMCPYYQRWRDMLMRCCSEKFQIKYPTYIGCTVCKEWLTFSSFKRWMKKQEWEGRELDKDIIYPGNKVYSPETCLFVSGAINRLFTDSKAARGIYPQGVSLTTSKENKFQARCKVNGKKVYLGSYRTEGEASIAYLRKKGRHVLHVAKLEKSPILRVALSRHVIKIIEEIKDLGKVLVSD